MLDFIEKIKKEPEEKRRNILYVCVSILMLAIIYLWMINLDSIFNSGETQASVIESSSRTPFEVFSEKILYIRN
jgi:hypothetical protein